MFLQLWSEVLIQPISSGCSVVNCKATRILPGYTSKCYLSLLFRFIYSHWSKRKTIENTERHNLKSCNVYNLNTQRRVESELGRSNIWRFTNWKISKIDEKYQDTFISHLSSLSLGFHIINLRVITFLTVIIKQNKLSETERH